MRNIGLAVTAILASIFVVWQTRISGGQAKTDRTKSSADRYREASVMLADNNLVVRIAGVQLLEELSRDDKCYRSNTASLLNHFADGRGNIKSDYPDVLMARSVSDRLKRTGFRLLVAYRMESGTPSIGVGEAANGPYATSKRNRAQRQRLVESRKAERSRSDSMRRDLAVWCLFYLGALGIQRPPI